MRKREYAVPESSTDFLRIFMGLKLKHLSTVLENEELYKSLKQHLSKSLAVPDVLLDFMAQPPTNMDTDIYFNYCCTSCSIIYRAN